MLLAFPKFFSNFFAAMQAHDGNRVGILTSRRASEKDQMLEILKQMNITPDFYVAMPDDMKDKDYPQGIFKGIVCNDLEVDLLFDDFLSDDPTMIADFFTTNQRTTPFTSWAYDPA